MLMYDNLERSDYSGDLSSPKGSGLVNSFTLVGVIKLVCYDMLLYLLLLCQFIDFLLCFHNEGCHKCGAVLNRPSQALNCIL